MARIYCPTFTSILFPVDEAELKESTKINFCILQLETFLQSSIFCAFISFFEDEQSGCTLIFASKLSHIMSANLVES